MYYTNDNELLNNFLRLVNGGNQEINNNYKDHKNFNREISLRNEKKEGQDNTMNVKKAKATMTMLSINYYSIAVDVPGYKGCELDVTFSEEQGFVVKANNAARGEFCYKSGIRIFEKPIDIDSINVTHEDGVVYCNFSYLIKPTIKEPIRFTF